VALILGLRTGQARYTASMELRPLPDRDQRQEPGQAEPSDEREAYAPLCAIFRRYLKGCGQKFTLERAQILDAIIRKDEIFEVEELLGDMKGEGSSVSKATVYRTIRLLQEAGIIEQVLFDRKQAHYQLVFGRAPKDHMTCVNTGQIVEFSCPELIEICERVCKEHGWTPVGHRFQIFAESPGSTAENGEESA
jgi:Fur family transcriptional regulator, ferric uptake regulator